MKQDLKKALITWMPMLVMFLMPLVAEKIGNELYNHLYFGISGFLFVTSIVTGLFDLYTKDVSTKEFVGNVQLFSLVAFFAFAFIFCVPVISFYCK